MIYQGLSIEAALFWFVYGLLFIVVAVRGIDIYRERHHKRGTGKIKKAA